MQFLVVSNVKDLTFKFTYAILLRFAYLHFLLFCAIMKLFCDCNMNDIWNGTNEANWYLGSSLTKLVHIHRWCYYPTHVTLQQQRRTGPPSAYEDILTVNVGSPFHSFAKHQTITMKLLVCIFWNFFCLILIIFSFYTLISFIIFTDRSSRSCRSCFCWAWSRPSILVPWILWWI